MASGPGRRDRLVTVQRYTTTTNDFNEPETTWADLTDVWTEKHDISDMERVRAQQAGEVVSTRFRFPHAAVPDLTAQDRLVLDGVVYEIRGVKEIGRAVEWEVTTATGV